MKQLTGFTVLVLFSIAFRIGAGNAAQENFEINLKELRPAPDNTKQTQQPSTIRSKVTKPQALPKTGKTEGSSSYTVRRGDNLFSILMWRYNLSNEAAERLIPEMMRLNNISNPQGLTAGQRLTIPLPTPAERQSKNTRKQPTQTAPASIQIATPALTQTVQPKPQAQEQPQAQPPQLSIKPQAEKKQPVATTVLREVSISAASPCILAHELVKQLDLLVLSTKLIPGEDSLTAEHAGLKVVIACGLSPDKTYTYDRLLALHNIQLLSFAGAETSSYVIRKLANRLSLDFRQSETDVSGNQPSTYIFPANGPNGQEIRVTIIPSKQEQ